MKKNNLIDVPLTDYGMWNRRPKGEIGIEIEIEGGPWPEGPCVNWEVHNDGSLRNGGIEYVIRQPVRRDKAKEALVTLSEHLAKSRKVFSSRTSVHVHVNVQSFTLRQLANFIVLYTILEEVLVDAVGPSRAGNKFCLRFKDAEVPLDLFGGVLRGHDLWRTLQGRGLKYGAMNIQAVTTHGTLEFRSMEGNLDPDLINDWIQIIGILKDMAAKAKNPQEFIGAVSREGALAFLQEVLPKNSITKKIVAQAGLEDKVLSGARLAQDIAFAIDWDAPKEEAKPRFAKPADEGIAIADLIWPNRDPALAPRRN